MVPLSMLGMNMYGATELLDGVQRISSSLAEKITQSYNNHMKILAIVGACYIVLKSFNILSGCYGFIKEYILPCFFDRTKHLKQYGKWAVVTGGTDGIGKAYAEELASYGINILLISRSIDKLKKVSESIAATYGVKTRFIQSDLNLGRQVFPAIKEGLKDLDVGILVNNAGVLYDYPDIFTEVPEEKVWEIMNVNMTAAVMMVHIVLPGMVQRKRGAIINVASASCYSPVPLYTVYASSKTFLDQFSQTLHYEYASEGIFIQSLTPCFVVTKMIAYADLYRRKSLLIPLPADYVRQAVRTIGVTRRTAGYWSHYFQVALTVPMPEWIRVPLLTYLAKINHQEYMSKKIK
ncbi:hydroxysteroid dehydrogenase-like protein 1 isoform X2 [Hyperolius riggenbachi]|uniref:hydroxysteroid dehydrogenase-like protein 1 isoform X2 n=1 Tax=Hyperolius riggenbachi TaxID=752182 RepID=UPI0035A34C93